MKKRNLKKIGLVSAIVGLLSVGLFACGNVAVMAQADEGTSGRQPLTRDYPTSSVVYFLSSSDINAISINGGDFVSSHQAVFTYDNSSSVTTVSQFPVSNFVAVLTSVEWGSTGVTDAPFYCSKATWTYWESKHLQILNDDSSRFAGSLSAFICNDVVQDGVSKKHIGFYGASLSFQPMSYFSATPTMNFDTAIVFAPLLDFYSTYTTYRPSPSYLTFKHFSSWLNYNFGTLYAEFASAQIEDAYNAGYDKGKEDGYPLGVEDGKQQGYTTGYNAGYNAGQSDISDSGIAVSNLFGAIASVPISVLNGLSGFVVWNIPLISICVTFLFIGIALWIAKKFI